MENELTDEDAARHRRTSPDSALKMRFQRQLKASHLPDELWQTLMRAWFRAAMPFQIRRTIMLRGRQHSYA